VSIAYVDGIANYAATSPLQLVIPSDVPVGGVLCVYGSVFANAVTISLSGTANAPVQMYYGYNGVNDSYLAWAIEVGAGDPGATLTFTENGADTYIAGIILGYSGAGMPPANTGGANQGYAYANGGFSNTPATTWTAPALAAGAPVAGCWGVGLITAGVGSGDGSATYGGWTSRPSNPASGANSADSNGPVGGQGSAIGGGTWTTTADGENVGITLALPPPAAPASGGPPRGDYESRALVRRPWLW